MTDRAAKHPSRSGGFTILELMVTLAVMAVLLAIAVPAFRAVMRRTYINSVSNTLIGDLQYARSEAATRHQFVSVCRSVDGLVCAIGSKDLDVGYLVYAYNASATGANQVFTSSKADHVILRKVPLQAQVSVQGTDGEVLTFGQMGTPLVNGTRTSMNFVLCTRNAGATTGVGANTNENPGIQVGVGASGSLSTTKLAAGAACTAS